jgi:radical SAM protein with 4Fe4S-binding SPASM domain
MLYFQSEYQAEEADQLRDLFGIEIPSARLPEIRPDSILQLAAVYIQKLELQGNGYQTLYLNPKTATWCYLDEDEAELCENLASPISFSNLAGCAQLPSDEIAKKFFIQLYNLALLKIDGATGIDEAIYARGPLFNRNYLVELLLTEECNLACTYCFADAKPGKMTMSFDVVRQTIDKAIKLPSEHLKIEFAGGEPFIEFELLKKAVYYTEKAAEEAGKRVEILVQSNGTLFTDDVLRFIGSTRTMDVGVSLDGTKDANDKTRLFASGEGSYDSIIEGLKRYRSILGNLPGIVTIVHRHNWDRAEELLEFFESLGVVKLRFNPVLRLGRGNSKWNQIGITPEEYFCFMKEVVEYIGATSSLEETNLEIMVRNLLMRRRDFRCMRSPCGAGFDYIVVAPNGDLFPCAKFTDRRELCLGNLSQVDSLEHCFLNNPLVLEMADRLVVTIEECRDCLWRHFCEGECSLGAYTTYGSFHKPSPLCEFYKRIYPYLMDYLGSNPSAICRFVPDAVSHRFMRPPNG